MSTHAHCYSELARHFHESCKKCREGIPSNASLNEATWSPYVGGRMISKLTSRPSVGPAILFDAFCCSSEGLLRLVLLPLCFARWFKWQLASLVRLHSTGDLLGLRLKPQPFLLRFPWSSSVPSGIWRGCKSRKLSIPWLDNEGVWGWRYRSTHS